MPDLNFYGVPFPGRAGDLQRARDLSGLVAELGDNYQTYHQHLVKKIDELGGFPKPDMSVAWADYLDAFDRFMNYLTAENALRRAYGARTHGRDLGDLGDVDDPLINDHGQLVAMREGPRRRRDDGSPMGSFDEQLLSPPDAARKREVFEHWLKKHGG